MAAADFERLEILCRRVSTLPVLPTTALQLIRTIDSGDASAAELERIISNDPGLSTEFIRLATSSQLDKRGPQMSSIRTVLMRMGQRTVRSLATSLLVRDLVKNDSMTLDKKHFARHSLAVGLIAKFLFARRKANGGVESQWTPDEMFAVGLLSDLGYVLVARMLPDTYMKLLAFSKRNGCSLDDTFVAAFGKPPSLLAAAAADTWGLPEIFKLALANIHEPWENREEFTALACLHLAGALAKEFELGIEDWPIEVVVSPQVMLEVGLPDEEKENLRAVILDQLQNHGDSIGGAPAEAA